MPSIIELGQKVKAKYPDYKDMSDFEVGQKVRKWKWREEKGHIPKVKKYS